MPMVGTMNSAGGRPTGLMPNSGGSTTARTQAKARPGEDQVQRIGEPRQPAGDEVELLPEGELGLVAQHLAGMRLHDLHGAVGQRKRCFL